MLKYAILSLFVTIVLCEKNYGGYTRIKRGKYNSPPRFHSRPPPSSPYQGWVSYTPPPGYIPEDGPAHPGNFGPPFTGNSGSSFPDPPTFAGSSGPPSFSGNSGPPTFSGNSGPPLFSGNSGPPSFSGPPYQGNSRPPKVSKPQSDGLGEDEISNLIKHLSKADLDKIMQLTGRDKDTEKYNKYEKYEKDPFEKFSDFNPNNNDIKVYSPSDKFKLTSDDVDYFQKLVQEMEADSKFKHIEEPKEVDYVTQSTSVNSYPSQNEYPSLDTEESMLRQQYLNIGSADTDSVAEVNMPRPLNLRENDDFEISYTKNVPKVIQSDSYDLKNFGELPVMNYDSKLDTLSSYHVPHYTVTSQDKPSYASSQGSSFSSSQSTSFSSSSSSYGSKNPPLESAPPPSAAKSQSDAHLKAVKIWSHRSQGTAYTLHDDGTLSLEKPGRPKGRYGYP